MFGRLLPDVSVAEAEAQLSGVAAGVPAATAGESAVRVTLDPHVGLGRMAASEAVATTVFVFAVIALVLLLACANVATVLISTAITREREMGVRAALGASRGRLVRQLVTESLALGTIAAAIGLLFAYWALPTIGSMIEAPAGTDLAPDLNVFLFLGIVTLLTGVGAGLAPAWHGRSADLLTPLKGEGARPNRMAPRRLRSMLVMTQAAVSVLLIVLSSLFVRATVRAATIDVGFDAAGLYAVSPGLGEAVDDDGAAIRNFWARATSELEAVPGLAGIALADVTPFDGLTKSSITRDGLARVVYFTSARDRVLRDHRSSHRRRADFYARRDRETRASCGCQPVACARLLARPVAIGQLLPEEIPALSTRPVVVGVVADAITARLHERNTFAVYEPFDPAYERFAQLLIRVAPGATGGINHASQRLRAIDPQADVRIASVAARLEQEAGRPRMLAVLTGVVGVIAIVLCVIGLYGLTASVVGQRAREMSVRIAMGAAPRDLLRLLMWDSLRPVVFGLAVGAGALCSPVAWSSPPCSSACRRRIRWPWPERPRSC